VRAFDETQQNRVLMSRLEHLLLTHNMGCQRRAVERNMSLSAWGILLILVAVFVAVRFML